MVAPDVTVHPTPAVGYLIPQTDRTLELGYLVSFDQKFIGN